ncbi:MAG: hypothetical protein GX612_01640 [Bacteroidales bacterium]|nr:hypothetical protein [Bacteroidales bacterium]
MLDKELQYYIDNQNELVAKYLGKFLVIKDQTIIGVYDTEIEAYSETVKKHELGTFLIQECQPGDENYTQTFRTRVIFR